MEVEVDDVDDVEVFSITSDSNSTDSQLNYHAQSASSSQQIDEQSTQSEQSSTPPASCSQKRPSEQDDVTSASKKRKVSDENEDDGKLCNICLDNWTNSGGHRICALKCGHLFGHSCILRWILSNKSCPTCKVKGGKGDIRFIYANKLIPMDTTELEIIRKQLDRTIKDKNRIQIELTKSICKEHLLVQEIEDYKRKINWLGNTNQVKMLDTKSTVVLAAAMPFLTGYLCFALPFLRCILGL